MAIVLHLGCFLALLHSTGALFGVESLFRKRSLLPPLRAGASRRLALDYAGTGSPEKILILVDGFCPYHSRYVAARALDIPGVGVVHLLSDYLSGFLEKTGQESPETLELLRLPKTKADAAEFVQALGGKDTRIIAVYCESDSGLENAEQLRELLNVECSDNPVVLDARRNKHLMQQSVQSKGLSVAEGQLCKSLEEAVQFAERLFEKKEKVVVKPIRGVASESVYLCSHIEEVEAAWTKITESQVYGGTSRHETVLVQERLEGTEYAVDVVSRNGQHKIAAVWRYLKKPANGAAFCYFKTELVDDSADDNVKAVCDYVQKALSALGVRWGISHNEVIVDSNGPKLIEVNCRQHNMDFLPLTMAAIGYNALDMYLVSAFGDDNHWDSYPDMPVLRAHACMVHLVNFVSGTLKQLNHVEEMFALPSVLEGEIYEPFRTPGSRIEPTIDIRSDAGWLQLLSEDQPELERDYQQIEAWMPTMFGTED